MPSFLTLILESLKQRTKRAYYAAIIPVVYWYNKRSAGKGRGWWSDE